MWSHRAYVEQTRARISSLCPRSPTPIRSQWPYGPRIAGLAVVRRRITALPKALRERISGGYVRRPGLRAEGPEVMGCVLLNRSSDGLLARVIRRERQSRVVELLVQVTKEPGSGLRCLVYMDSKAESSGFPRFGAAGNIERNLNPSSGMSFAALNIPIQGLFRRSGRFLRIN